MELFKTFGPWTMVILAMAGLLKILVTDRLNLILEKLAKVDEHEVELAQIKTAMKINGCMDPEDTPRCAR